MRRQQTGQQAKSGGKDDANDEVEAALGVMDLGQASRFPDGRRWLTAVKKVEASKGLMLYVNEWAEKKQGSEGANLHAKSGSAAVYIGPYEVLALRIDCAGKTR